MAEALAYRSDDSAQDALIKSALVADLSRIKAIIKTLGNGNGDRAAVFSFKKAGFGVLHCVACQGHLEVCKYLVEELGGDLNMTAAEGVTPFMSAAQSDDVSTVKYFLDHGADLMKADEKGRTVLHHLCCVQRLPSRRRCTHLRPIILLPVTYGLISITQDPASPTTFSLA